MLCFVRVFVIMMSLHCNRIVTKTPLASVSLPREGYCILTSGSAKQSFHQWSNKVARIRTNVMFQTVSKPVNSNLTSKGPYFSFLSFWNMVWDMCLVMPHRTRLKDGGWSSESSSKSKVSMAAKHLAKNISEAQLFLEFIALVIFFPTLTAILSSIKF